MEEQNGRNDPSMVPRNTTFMDPDLWGSLQYHMDVIESVYCRLPVEEFFELRAVCKAWYDVACKRMALEEHLHKPFFTLNTRGGRSCRLYGVLTYNKCRSSSNSKALSKSRPSSDTKPSWVWTRRVLAPSSRQIVASEGLVCTHSSDSRYPRYPLQVYDWNLHGRRPVCEVSHNGSGQTVIGMSVLQKEQNENLHPFKIILGSLEHDTLVFDSESQLGEWETKPCRPIVRGDLHQTTGCAHCNGRVYITMEFSREILVYDFGDASWRSIDAPGGCSDIQAQRIQFQRYSTLFNGIPSQHYCNDTLGAWNGHILDVVDDTSSLSLLLWELVDDTNEWRVFDRMPTDLYSFWLRFKDGSDHMADLTIHASFCGDYVLVYSWVFKYERAWRYCLYNIATKVWQQLDIDDKTVYIKKRPGIADWDEWDF